jgi:acyl-CoA reductase-like NAD-dependent aldehyde dehydrogenase
VLAVVEGRPAVGGSWTDAAEGGTTEVLNPATGETIAEVPSCTAADVDAAVEAAGKALPEWLDATPAERAELLLKLADVLSDFPVAALLADQRAAATPAGL